MKIISWNVNGLNACVKNDGLKSVFRLDPDIICIQREMIKSVNRMLNGWGNYQRYCEAEAAFRRIDAVVQASLLEALINKYPRMEISKIISKYWYSDNYGHKIYALRNDKTVQIMQLKNVNMVIHKQTDITFNPFLGMSYREAITHERAIHNIIGAYKAIWTLICLTLLLLRIP